MADHNRRKNEKREKGPFYTRESQIQTRSQLISLTPKHAHITTDRDEKRYKAASLFNIIHDAKERMHQEYMQ